MLAQALDPIHDSRHGLAPDGRESLAFILSLPQQRIGVIMYSWVTGTSVAGAMLAVFGDGAGPAPVIQVLDGIAVPAGMGFDDWRVGPMQIRHEHALERASLRFAGAEASIEFSFDAIGPAYNYGQHQDGCPWFLADDRFEQSGRAAGMLTIGEQTIPYETTAHRDHSWGTRDWAGARHWKWINIQAGDALAVHAMEIDAGPDSGVRGYITKQGETAELTAIASAETTFGPGLMHETYAARLTDALGRATVIAFTARAPFEFKVDPRLTLNEVSGSGTIDGIAGVGHIEMAWPPEEIARHRVSTG